MQVISHKNLFSAGKCRERAIEKFSAEDRYKDYLRLYEERVALS
jgi:hypothetical protein